MTTRNAGVAAAFIVLAVASANAADDKWTVKRFLDEKPAAEIVFRVDSGYPEKGLPWGLVRVRKDDIFFRNATTREALNGLIEPGGVACGRIGDTVWTLDEYEKKHRVTELFETPESSPDRMMFGAYLSWAHGAHFGLPADRLELTDDGYVETNHLSHTSRIAKSVWSKEGELLGFDLTSYPKQDHRLWEIRHYYESAAQKSLAPCLVICNFKTVGANGSSNSKTLWVARIHQVSLVPGGVLADDAFSFKSLVADLGTMPHVCKTNGVGVVKQHGVSAEIIGPGHPVYERMIKKQKSATFFKYFANSILVLATVATIVVVYRHRRSKRQ